MPSFLNCNHPAPARTTTQTLVPASPVRTSDHDVIRALYSTSPISSTCAIVARRQPRPLPRSPVWFVPNGLVLTLPKGVTRAGMDVDR
ncbi:MAG TPA: hypothetical protein VIJ07_20665 [Dermatophilaceae bacterium]